MTIADLTAKIENLTGIQNLGEPTCKGVWATWEQRGSKGIMLRVVNDLKAAGIPAFFSAAERRFGVKIN